MNPSKSNQTTNELTIVEIIQLIEQRSSLYALLSRLFAREVDQDVLNSLATINWQSLAALPNMDEGALSIGQFVASPPPEAVVQLAADYATTFLDGVTITGAYPYESVYTSKDRLLMQDARDEVLEIYRQEGLEIPPERKDPEDHIGFELELMQFYSEKTKAALSVQDYQPALDYLKKQLSFLEAHLLNWTPRFFKDAARIAGTDFYKGLAKLADAFLNNEKETITSLLAEVDAIEQK